MEEKENADFNIYKNPSVLKDGRHVKRCENFTFTLEEMEVWRTFMRTIMIQESKTKKKKKIVNLNLPSIIQH